MYATNAAVKGKPATGLMNGIQTQSRPLRYRCSVIPTELSSQLAAGHFLNS